MQNTTSILSPAESNLVITFKYFSYDFKFDLCHDFSFWKADTGRCIPKEMHEGEIYYSFPPLCNRTEFECMKGTSTYKKYCPNKDKRCEEEQHFFCNVSKTCIPNGNNLIYIHTDRITQKKFQF